MRGLAMPIVRAPDDGKKAPDGGRNPLIERLCVSQKAELIERYGVYKDSHALTNYVRSLPIAKRNPDIRIEVLKRFEEPNAFSFPDGTVLLSDRLFELCEFKEELEFIIQHEIRHIRGEHTEKAWKEESMRARLGRSRMNEYEADIADMLKDEETSVNPLGGMIFLNRMAELEGGQEGFGPIHGDTYVRLAGMEYLVRLVELDSLSPDLKRIPLTVKGSPERQKDLWSLLADADKADQSELQAAADRIGFLGAISCYKRIHVSALPVDIAEALLSKLAVKITSTVAERFPDASEEAHKAMSAFLILFAQDPMVFGRAHDAPSKEREMGKLDTQLINRIADSDELSGGLMDMLKAYPKDFPACNTRINLDPFLVRAALKVQQRFGKHEAYTRIHALYMACKDDCLLPNPYVGSDERVSNLLMGSFGTGKEEALRFVGRLLSDGVLPRPYRIIDRMSSHFKISTKETLEAIIHGTGLVWAEDIDPGALDKAMDAFIMNRSCFHDGVQDFKDNSSRFMQVADPRSLGEFIAFLKAYSNLENCLFGTLGTMDYGEKFYPIDGNMLNQELCRRLKISGLTNDEALSLLEVTNPGLELARGIGMHKRIYDKEQLTRLAKLMPYDMPTFILRQLGETVPREEAFGLLKLSLGLEECPSTGHMVFDHIWAEVVEYFLERFRFDMGDARQLDELLTLSCFIKDPNLKLRLQKAVLGRLPPMLDFDKAYALLFHDVRVADYAATDAREMLLDRRVKDPEELERVKQDILERISGVESKAVGAAVLQESLMSAMLRDKERLLVSLLSTKSSNAGLREHLAEAYLAAFIAKENDFPELRWFIEKFYKESYPSTFLIGPRQPSAFLDEFEQLLYNLDYDSRFILCQQLLIGEGGVLLDLEKRRRVLGWFFDNFVAEPSGDGERHVRGFLRKAIDAVSENADVPTLYFLVQPVIVERILGRPKENCEWQLALERAKEKALSDIPDPQDHYYIGEGLDDAIGLIEWEGKTRIQHYGCIPSRLDEREREQQNSVIRLNLLCEEYLTEIPETVPELSPIQFVKHLSTNLGAPGVRFLQALGIYADMPAELRKEFDDVYDNVKGQLKLSAAHTLRKSWNGSDADGLDELRERIGGGSLVTVYRGKVHGEGCVIKVVNPNVAFRTGRICDNLGKVFSSDDSLKRAIPLLDNIRTWIGADAGFSAPELVEEFKERNHGFRDAGNPYSINVPRILKGSERFVAEEFVEGRNLTRWDELAQTHDMKAIVSLLVKNTVHQVSNGLVHADIHVGNITVTDDNKVALLDRNYLLLLSEEDKRFLGSLVILHGDRAGLAKAIGGYLCGFEENKHVDEGALTGKLSEVLHANGHRDVGSFVSDCVAVLSEHQAILPLNVMLLLKNALALERMAKRAGFGNVLEAYTA